MISRDDWYGGARYKNPTVSEVFNATFDARLWIVLGKNLNPPTMFLPYAKFEHPNPISMHWLAPLGWELTVFQIGTASPSTSLIVKNQNDTVEKTLTGQKVGIFRLVDDVRPWGKWVVEIKDIA